MGYESIVLIKRTDWMAWQLANERYKKKQALSVLDIGCGIGTVPYYLGELGYKVTGVDFDPISIESCNKNNKRDNVKFQVGNAETLQMENKYDVVIETEILEHMEHPELGLQTIARNLKDGGIGIVSVPNGWCPWEMVMGRFIQKGIIGSWLYNSPKVYTMLTGSDNPFNSKNVFCFHVNFFSYKRFKKLVENNGFKIRTIGHPSLGILPEWKAFDSLKKVECKISDYVPHSMAGGWLMVIEKK
jgi:2-polyprenyl-3-methyl-5-hydroxy-6-metoxy-1,4-benzoquinol methylase